jgi:hypothetical protein
MYEGPWECGRVDIPLWGRGSDRESKTRGPGDPPLGPDPVSPV